MAGTVSGALSLATLLEIHSSNPALYHGLTHRARRSDDDARRPAWNVDGAADNPRT